MTPQERFAALAEQPMTLVTSHSASLGASWAALRDVLKQREMLGLLVRRDLKSKYKDSGLGFLWTLIRPLTQLFIYFVVVGHFLGAARGIPDFAVYVFTGLAAYGLFSEIVSSGTSSIVVNSGLIKKIYLPREVFPLASVGSALFNFGIQLVILIIATLLVGKPPISANIIYFIPALLVLLTYGTALALLFAAINVYLRDIQYLVEVALMVLMWASPILYSWEMVAGTVGQPLSDIYVANPITVSVMGFQKAFWLAGDGGAVVYPGHLMLRLLISFVIGLVLVVLCQRVFARLQGNFAQEL
ncbi:ABC transporter permease [Gryllotalpicola protaetiae]|uniref:Transport permease protein n=1 Tax=Gryllotalpicola protaetiae TaxID=2419771 RepID=A0A387BNJ3_9MICO|nr:ABC transporter permease [Gryllotalpicola protaetiae]AYG04278.1 ABC transporter permease [Gryllotalpicola protaetiae]